MVELKAMNISPDDAVRSKGVPVYHGSLIRILERCFIVSEPAADKAVQLGVLDLLLMHLDPRSCPGCPTEKCLRALIQWPAANAALWDTDDFPCRAELVKDGEEGSYGAQLEECDWYKAAQYGTAMLMHRLFGPAEGPVPRPLQVIPHARRLVEESEAAAQRYMETLGQEDRTASEVRCGPLFP